MTLPQPDDARLELKKLADAIMLPEVRSWLQLHPAAFGTSYPPRRVNNAYLDSYGLTSLEENLSGTSQRHKVRIRWYGDTDVAEAPRLEIKCKRNMTGWKRVHALECELDFTRHSWSELLRRTLVDLPPEFRSYLSRRCMPVLINRYEREYYESSDGRLRVTLDYDQRVFDQRLSDRPNLRFPTGIGREMVVEFKASTEHRKDLATATSGFPLRVAKCSKYVRGLLSLQHD